jgi:hypothetical protein
MTVGTANRRMALAAVQEFRIVEIVSLGRNGKGKRKKEKGKN